MPGQRYSTEQIVANLRESGFRGRREHPGGSRCTLIGYLFTCPVTVPVEARSRRLDCRSHIGCPRWACGLSFGLRSSGRRQGGERLESASVCQVVRVSRVC
jgi:hypothetical protein